MPSPFNVVPALRACAFRPRQARAQWQSNVVIGVKRPACRTFADKSKDLPVMDQAEEQVGPNMRQQEHVSEEAAKMAKITGGEGPDLDQGTPVQDILKDDKEAQKHAPQVMKDSMKSKTSPAKPSTRPFSTLARRQMPEIIESSGATYPAHPALYPPPTDLQLQESQTRSAVISPTSGEAGYKFPLPELPLPSNMGKDYRYDPIVKQVTNLLMQDGKLSVAQRNMAVILNTLRTASAPTYSTSRPLLPGAPPATHLPLNPTLYLTLAVDSVSPLLRIRSQRGAAGGGVALQIPVPLGLRQRRRQAVVWILDAASKRKSRGSGKDQFAQRVAEELIAVVEGRSSVWEKRNAVHKLGTTARSNLNFGRAGGRR